MSRILISGLINLETTLRVDGFPLEYFPVCYPFFGVSSRISGVGFNIAKAMTVLGDQVGLISMVGDDLPGQMAFQALAEFHISSDYVSPMLAQTAESVIMYDPEGRRQIHVDLKNIQDEKYSEHLYIQASQGADLAVLCNINFSRPFLEMTRSKNIPIATDVHAIATLDDPYNLDFMANSDILFMSHERLPERPDVWAQKVINRFRVDILIIGMGKEGALIAVKKDRKIKHFPAFTIRPVVNSIGAGDALFSCFLHYYLQSNDPYSAIRKAMLFAAYKIGVTGAAEGFLTENELDALAATHLT